ncbi:MAG: hypothetical protein GY941_19660 [Planctomycetes bacterium]|nr:hypothetical protein [Planctomycetota bacterium]
MNNRDVDNMLEIRRWIFHYLPKSKSPYVTGYRAGVMEMEKAIKRLRNGNGETVKDIARRCVGRISN